MKKNNLILLLIIFFMGYISITHAQSAAIQSNPILLLQYIANNMIAGLKANKATLKSKPQIVYRLAYQYVVPYASLSEMSKRVLPPAVWNHATPDERARFQKEFTTTIIRTYASALTSYQDQTIRFFPIRGQYQHAGTVEVMSEIESSESSSVRVSYRLIRMGNVWRLYDMSVEGVSMLESFRAQFSSILSQGNMSQLLQKMAAHNNR